MQEDFRTGVLVARKLFDQHRQINATNFFCKYALLQGSSRVLYTQDGKIFNTDLSRADQTSLREYGSKSTSNRWVAYTISTKEEIVREIVREQGACK